MKTIASLRDLDQFGIVALTGEADALSFRILCDLTEFGRSVVAETLGINPIGFPKNWNSRAVASCLLCYEMVMPLGVVAGILSGKTVVVTDKKTVFILDEDQDVEFYGEENRFGYWFVEKGEKQPWPNNCYGKITLIRKPPQGNNVQGLRNVHQMSGRVV